ncbi:Zinc finger and BTB domain-containing protein 20 [Bienertia sinuspersici]
MLCSPNGRYFVSCKEVSSYLLSLTSLGDSKPQSAVQCLEDSVDKFSSENAIDLGSIIEYPSLCVTPQSNDQKSLQKSTSQCIVHDKQLTSFTNAHSGELQASSALKCHKCSTPFGGKDELLNHLLSCHKRKRRKSGAPIEDDIMMKDGKYECQFCSKVFHERSSYFGHVGIHVKNYVKSIGGSQGLTVTSKQNFSALSCAEVPATVSAGEVLVTVSEIGRDVEMNGDPIASAPNTLASNELNLNSAETKPEAGCEAETHIGHGVVDQSHFSLHAELINGAQQNNNISAVESSCKHDGTAHTTDNNVKEVEEAVDRSAMKPDSCSGSEHVYNSDNNDLCEDLGAINTGECLGSEISKSSAELVESDEICFLSNSKQIDLENEDHLATNPSQREVVASESDLCAEYKEDSSGDQNSEDGSFGNNNTVNHSCFTEGLEPGDDNGLIDHSNSGHRDLGFDAADDVQHPGSLDECSDILHKEEERCDTTANKIELMKSPLVIANDNVSPSEDLPTTVMENYVGKDFISMVSETEVDMCSLDDNEAAVDADNFVPQERPESRVALLSKDNACGYIVNEAETIPHIEMVEPRETGVFQVKQTCTLEKTLKELSNTEVDEHKSDQVINSGNLFFPSRSNGTHLAADVTTDNDQAHSDVSNVLGAFNSFVENKQEHIPKSFLSGLSINEQLREVAMNNVTDVPSTTTSMQLPELNKVDNSRSNKLIFDFGNITEMNARFLGSVQNGAVPNGTSPFSVWGQQTCTIEDNQTRIYDGARGVAQQERVSDNNPLDLVGLQQPSDVGYNLNEVCMNEQRYGVQRNETGVYRENNEVRREGMYRGAGGIVQQERTSDNNSLNLVSLQQPTHAEFNLNKTHMNEQRYGVQLNESGVYSKSNDSRREISHGNTLNRSGHQRQCDAEYNLNKPCINQQSYGMHCNETGTYSTSNESKQDRMTYGNSLSLASVPQTCDTRYSLNKSCIQQTCDSGFSLDKGYMGTIQGLSKLDELGHTQDQDLMIGFRNSDGRPNQGVATEFLWRAAEEIFYLVV